MRRHVVKLNAAEREQLRVLTRTGSAKAQELRRAHLLLNADENGAVLKDEHIASALSVTVETVERIRKRYNAEGLKSIRRKPRPDKGIPRKLNPAQVQALKRQLEAEQKLIDFRREAFVCRQLRAAHVAPSGLRHVLALNLLRLAYRLSPRLAAVQGR